MGMDVASIRPTGGGGDAWDTTDLASINRTTRTNEDNGVLSYDRDVDSISDVPKHRSIPVLSKENSEQPANAETVEKEEPLRIGFTPVDVNQRWKELPREVYEQAILAGSLNYDTGAINHASEAEAMSVVRALAKRGPVVVDIGGEGRHPRALNINVGVLKSSNETEAIPRVVLGSAFNLPLAANSADTITVESSPVDAAQLARVIKPGGTIKLYHPADYGESAHQKVHTITGGDKESRIVDLGGIDMLETTIYIPGPRKEPNPKA